MKIMVVLMVAMYGLMILLVGMRPAVSNKSRYEVSRLERLELASADDLLRARQSERARAAFLVAAALLLPLFTLVLVVSLGPWVGVLFSFVTFLLLPRLGGLRPVGWLASRLYRYIELPLLRTLAKYGRVLDGLRWTEHRSELKVHSREELAWLLESSSGLLSSFEARLVRGALELESLSVEDIMVPWPEVITIDHDELLGPVTLDDLHKSGHQGYPVTGKDLSEIVGILHIASLLAVDGTRNSKKAREAMDKEISYIHRQQSLPVAFDAFVLSGKSMLIVIDGDQSVVGLLTLKDIANKLLGSRRKSTSVIDLSKKRQASFGETTSK